MNETRFDPKNVVPDISQPKKNLDTILMHCMSVKLADILMYWMSVKLADNFQIREHSWPCLIHINIYIPLDDGNNSQSPTWKLNIQSNKEY